MSGIVVSTTVNGDPQDFVCTPGETLLHALRDRLSATVVAPSPAVGASTASVFQPRCCMRCVTGSA